MYPTRDALLHQIWLCQQLEACEALSPKTRQGAAELRLRFEARLAELD